MTDRERRAAERTAATGDQDALARLRAILVRSGELQILDDGLDDLCRRTKFTPSDVAAAMTEARSAATGWSVRTARTWGTQLVAVKADVTSLELWGCNVPHDQPVTTEGEPPAVLTEALRLDPSAVHIRAAIDVARVWIHDRGGSDQGWFNVRVRPAMYFGDTSTQGANVVVDQLLEHAVHEYSTGHATRIDVSVDPDHGVTVADDGRGLLRVRGPGSLFGDATGVFGELATEDPSGDDYILAAACAASDPFEVTLARDGQTLRQVYRRGRPVAPVEVVAPSVTTGTRIRLRVDPRIFGDAHQDTAALASRVALLAYLVPGLRTSFLAPDPADTFDTHAPDGLAALVNATRTQGFLERVTTGTRAGAHRGRRRTHFRRTKPRTHVSRRGRLAVAVCTRDRPGRHVCLREPMRGRHPRPYRGGVTSRSGGERASGIWRAGPRRCLPARRRSSRREVGRASVPRSDQDGPRKPGGRRSRS